MKYAGKVEGRAEQKVVSYRLGHLSAVYGVAIDELYRNDPPEGGTGPGDELYRTDSPEGGTGPGDELYRTDSPEGSTEWETNCIELTHQSPEGGTGPGDELYRTDSLEGGTEPGDELFRTDSPEGSTGTGDELYRLDTSAVDVLYLGADYLHHVAVREEVAGEVEADGQRLSGRRFLEPHDRSLHLTLADAERLHSVDVRRNFAATDQSVLTTR